MTQATSTQSTPKQVAGRAGDALPAALLPAILALWRQDGGQQWIQTQGTSMLPFIREGDRLLLNSNLATLRRGSVVVFLQGDKLIAHRLLRIVPGSPPRFITKGDNAWSFDLPTSADNLLGHARTIQRQEHVIALDSAEWQTIGWLIATATLAIALPYGWLRRFKQSRWGHRPLPLVRLARRHGQFILRRLLKPFVPSTSQRSPNSQRDQTQYRL